MKEKILVGVLDWGLGHATRSIVVIEALIKAGHEVQVAGSGSSGHLLKSTFPGLKYYGIPAREITYARNNRLFMAALSQVPGIISNVKAEKKFLDDLQTRENFEVILSDNRYGLHHQSAECILMTHQLDVPVPDIRMGFIPVAFLFKWATRIALKRWLKPFGEVWVPDVSGPENLSGKLSEKQPGQEFEVFYTGALSRFSVIPGESLGADAGLEEVYDNVAVISGPEPHRTQLEQIMERELARAGGKSLIILGKPGAGFEPKKSESGVTVVNHLNPEQLGWYVSQANCVFSRPGYSSLMDYTVLRPRGLVLLCASGQAEQEYLGFRLQQLGLARCMFQEEFNYEKSSGAPGFQRMDQSRSGLSENLLYSHSLFSELKQDRAIHE